MDDLIKPNVEEATVAESESNAREVAFSLAFDQAALDGLEGGAALKKKKRAPAATAEPVAKKPKVAEVAGVDPVLFALQMKKNEARVISKKAASDEADLLAAGPFALKHKAAAEEKQKKREFEEKLEAAGVNPERYARLHETQEVVDAAQARKQRHGAEDVTTLGMFIDTSISIQCFLSLLPLMLTSCCSLNGVSRPRSVAICFFLRQTFPRCGS